MAQAPGLVVLFGSGETSASGRKVFDWLLSRMASPVEIAVLETPAGFEPNSDLVAGRIVEFLRARLQNYYPQVAVIPARKRGTEFSPDDPTILEPLLRAGAVFLGPGSPSYAVRQLKGSQAWSYLLARYRLGAAVVLASAAAIASGAFVLPVYEIYKVGEELHWKDGLDLFGAYGLSLAFVPHWDNREGGAELDTSRCYMGRARFERLLALLPSSATVVGIDEHTALVLDVSSQVCRVLGRGAVTVLRQGRQESFASGQVFPLAELGSVSSLDRDDRIPLSVWRTALAAEEAAKAEANAPDHAPDKVLALVEEREAARTRRDWSRADALREQIASLGWQIADTPQGPRLTPAASA